MTKEIVKTVIRKQLGLEFPKQILKSLGADKACK